MKQRKIKHQNWSHQKSNIKKIREAKTFAEQLKHCEVIQQKHIKLSKFLKSFINKSEQQPTMKNVQKSTTKYIE